MAYEDLPLTLSVEEVRAALASIGVTTERLLEVLITPHAVRVTYRRVDDQGRSVAVGREVATVVTSIGIDREGN